MTATDAQIEDFFHEQEWYEHHLGRVGRLTERHLVCQGCSRTIHKCYAYRLDDPPDKCCDECSHYWEEATP